MRTILRGSSAARSTQTYYATALIFCATILLTMMHSMPPATAQETRQQDVRPQDMRWSRFSLPATGVSLRVPLGVFEALPVDDSAQGRLFVSHDGKTQLLVGAFENDDNRSISAHRKFVIDSQYANADIDYAPLRRTWFVLSGTKDSRTFYQRVTFTCGGQIISSWAMLYPTDQKRFYDRIVERMHRSFQAGRGADGDCRIPAATN